MATTNELDVIVVGAGIGGLCAAIVAASHGHRVRIFEQASRIGGKAGVFEIDGVEIDTGPSVLTLPHIFDEFFERAELLPEERPVLIEHSPGFRYHYPDGLTLDVHHRLEDTLRSVQETLGSDARAEFARYLDHCAEIWTAAAPHFVFAEAPELSKLLWAGPAAWGALRRIDPLRTLNNSINAFVRTPHLKKLLQRYATYTGSDMRTAPATLACIAHVELELGGYGVRGGLRALIRSLELALDRLHVQIETNVRVDEVVIDAGRIRGVRTTSDFEHADVVIANTEAAFLDTLLKRTPPNTEVIPTSMSAYNAIALVERDQELAPHTVFFPQDYEDEFAAIFDRCELPTNPTLYLCAPERCHHIKTHLAREPLFAMINAPPLSPRSAPLSLEATRQLFLERLSREGFELTSDHLVWLRTPSGLAARFPASTGALYGAASNDKMAAFRRPASRVRGIRGLYFASGSGHPGGGVPLAAQAGKLAAHALAHDLKRGIL